MSRLAWDAIGQRLYETGVEKGVVFPYLNNGYSTGVAWNGLISVTESPSGAEPNPLYADNIKYLNLMSTEEFKATVEAYTYPKEFEVCDGTAEIANGVNIGQQKRAPFGLCYQTKIGNDTEGTEKGYKIHIIYGAQASPSEKGYSTINDNPEAISFSWELTTTPVSVDGHKPTATVTIDSTKVNDDTLMTAIEDIIYGKDIPAFSASKTYAVDDIVTHENKFYKCKTAISTAAAWDATKWDEIEDTFAPRLPLPAELVEMFRSA